MSASVVGHRPAGWRQSWTAFVLAVASRSVLGAVAVLLAVSVLPVAVGWQTSVVMSGSMAPVFEPGAVAVVRPVQRADLAPGQVLLVDDPDRPGRLRLHRLVAVQAGGLQLKGDANPTADSSLVDPASVHGRVVVGIPFVGEPAVWLAQGRPAPLAGTAAALLALLGLALAPRRQDPDGPTAPTGAPSDPPVRRRRRRVPAVLRRGTVTLAVAGVALALPGAAAGFSDTARSPAVTIPMAAWWTCSDVAGTTGANAARYYALQEGSGTTAADTGTDGASANGTYSSAGVSYNQSGPACGSGQNRAVTLDGASGAIWTTQRVSNPQTFSLQLWFRTTTAQGGKLIGFGNGTNGDLSTQYDRHVYMTNSGQLVFGVFPGTAATVTSSPGYNDGAWHLVTATFSAGTGMRLYLDGGLVGQNTSVAAAESDDGYWRIGYDNINTWPSAPTSNYFAGSLAHVSIYSTVLSATQVSQAWSITR